MEIGHSTVEWAIQHYQEKGTIGHVTGYECSKASCSFLVLLKKQCKKKKNTSSILTLFIEFYNNKVDTF